MPDQPSSSKPGGPGGKYQVEVPLDASRIEGFKPDQAVKVLAQGAKGPLASALVKFDEKGYGVAKLSFAEPPGGIRVIVGPHNATEKELTGLQTIGVDVPARRWGKETTLKLPPILIADYYWWWWYKWCRTFTISGRVVCPDGSSPVVGATVCAFDVDWWWWFSSTQQIGCATTDINGAFTMTFTWCCGWWPWWWWETKFWEVNPLLVERIARVTARNPELDKLIPRTAQPSLADFHELVGAEAAHITGETSVSPAALISLREPLLRKLPSEPEFEKLKIYPWYPWNPWNDCAPDVIFKVTQNCNPTGDPNVIVDENIWDVRWDIPTNLNNLTLIANDKACCLPPAHPCIDPECLNITQACGLTVDTIAGNVLAPVVPAALLGLYNANGASMYSDRPFGAGVSISGTTECTGNVDYYEFEWMTKAAWQANPAGPWNAMPPNANGGFTRQYVRFTPLAFPTVSFNPQSISGRNVFESLKHYETVTNPTEAWHLNAHWIVNRDMLINWLTHNFPAGDGTYYLRVKGYDSPSPNVLDLNSARVLHMCASQDPNYIVLTIDNRFVGPGPTDLHGNDCHSVHTCTNEPDTAIPFITILRAGGGTETVNPCGVYHVKWPDQVQIDFAAHDPDGYMLNYSLNTYYGVNQSVTLLNHALNLGPYPTSWSGVPAAVQPGPTYAHAVTQGGPGIRPVWRGGMIRLLMWATDQPSILGNAKGAFPITCCYQMRLDAAKRTIVGCNGLFTNTSETHFTIVVDPWP